MTDDQTEVQVYTLVFDYARRRIDKAKRDGRRFVHYTSTEAALAIINSGEIWLRNALAMNDYSEISHGEECLRHVLVEQNDVCARSKRVLDAVGPGLHDELVKYFEQTAVKRRFYTFLLSISEHGRPEPDPATPDPEDRFGRLSMWRAYGSGGGVGLILNQGPFFSETDVLGAYTSPVFYGMAEDFGLAWNGLLDRIERNGELIRTYGADKFLGVLKEAVDFAAMTTKHPGFSEEREWRVTFRPKVEQEHDDDAVFNLTSPIKREFRTIGSVPQRIYKIPLVDHPDQGLVGVALPQLISKVLIGPTQFPMPISDALGNAMARAGVQNVGPKLWASLIPLRT